jgi:hypothetical protein
MPVEKDRGRAQAAAGPLPECVKRLLEPYFPGFDLAAIRVRAGLPWYVLMRADAYTDCDDIYFARGSYDTHSAGGIALIGHEIAHCLQYRRLGKWRFRALYISSWARGLGRYRSLGKAYAGNRFEVEARSLQHKIYGDLYNLFGEDDPCNE